MKSNPQVYDSIGDGYRRRRLPDPRIAAQIVAALGNAKTVCNVGAGSGSYEPLDREVTAVEPSQTMIDQRRTSFPVVRATAEQLPFPEKHFDAAMAVLTVHHWSDAHKGLTEMQRVSRRQVVLAFDPEMVDSLWLVSDYLPEIAELERQRAIPIELIADRLYPARVETITVPWDCLDGFQAAYWRRPEEYLKPDVRAAISSIAQLSASIVSRAMQRLSRDIASGQWYQRYSYLMDVDEMDYGYRLVVSAEPAA
jgi:SAM-dependent methyltransferase